MHPLPGAEELADIYNEEYYTAPGGEKRYTYLDERKNPRGHRAVNTARLKRALRAVRKAFRSGRSKRSAHTPDAPPAQLNFLDVGCSFGALVQEANALGCRACGIDISAYAVEYARSEGLEVRQATPDKIPDFGVQPGFHIITMIEVIEHLPDPRAALCEIARVMSPDGLLIIQTANMDGQQAKKAGPEYHYYLPGHLYYFSRKTLTKLLEECGFENIQAFYPCEFGLLPKLKKARGTFESARAYLRLCTICWYHVKSKIRWRNFALTSGMVLYARRASKP
jgi:2-polyprenyl-3-methyl-5-hydroxy-6-metoxy-1,4-benzoquinol methylase